MKMNRSTRAGDRFVAYSSWFPKLIHLVLRVGKSVRDLFRRIPAHLFGTEISEAAFQKSLLPEYCTLQDFLEHFKEQQSQFFFISTSRKEDLIASLRQICPDAEHNIITAADTICAHYFDLLGSGPVNLGWPIDWHCDFKTGFRWDPRQYYADVRPAPYPGGYDLKVPWELSRCQHFVWLGQAYWLTGDEKYAHEFRNEIEDWILQNKAELGVNWACSMDIAIRAVNWLWGYAFFQHSAVLDDHFRIRFCKSLLCHGRHIMSNLERTPTFSGNHYLSDIVGLIYLGILLSEFKEAQNWRDFGLKELEREMYKQVYPDGGDFEASTSYHRLVAELFLSATLLARRNEYEFGEGFMERLEKMLDFIHQVTKPDGTFPVIGDQDNGRLHRLKVWNDPALEWKDFRPLLAVGCVLFDRPDWGEAAGNQWEEAIWLCGADALTAYEKKDQNPPVQMRSAGFDDTGLFIMRADDNYVAVDLGSIGQNGYGGHAHNDSLSFELFSSGRTWIQDPGTYVYTSDYKSRNLFRSTASHNTLMFSGYEQNRFNEYSLFAMKNESFSRLLTWYAEPDSHTYLAGEFYRLKKPAIVHRRSFFLDQVERVLIITDWVSGQRSSFWSVFHISPGLSATITESPYSGLRLIDTNGKNVQIFSVTPRETKIELSRGWVSESFGLRTLSDVVSVEQPADTVHKVVILLPGSVNDISLQLENAMNHEIIFVNKHQLM